MAVLLPEQRPWVTLGRIALVNAFFVATLATYYGYLPLAVLGVLVFLLGLLLCSMRQRWAFDLGGERLCCVRSMAGSSRLVQAIPFYDVAQLAFEAKEDDARQFRLHAILPGGGHLPLTEWISSAHVAATTALRECADRAAKATSLTLRPGVIWKIKPTVQGKSALDGFELPPRRKSKHRED